MTDNQKDTQRTSVNSYGHPGVSDSKSLVDNTVYEFANKKTEKLVTALYLVSDFMEADDALKGKLRLKGVDLLSDIYKLSTLNPSEKEKHISATLTHISELVSFIEIAYNIGFISEMNTMILKSEFGILSTDLKSKLDKEKHFTFTLDEEMFRLPELPSGRGNIRDDFIKDNSIGQDSKRTSYNAMSFMNNKSPLPMSQSKRTNFHVATFADKQERTNKILTLIKDKKDLQGNKDGVSIKDISLAFTDCSEKTIQRELNSLVEKGELKKSGAKRWSRYSIK